MVRFQDSNKRFISETTHTVIVNEHGALILLTASVEVDQIIRLENPNLGEEFVCRVTGLGPRFLGKTQVAVEFIMPTPGFWSCGSKSEDYRSRIDVEKSSSHQLSQTEIGSDNPCSQNLSEKVRLAQILSGLLPSGLLIRTQGARTYSWAGWQVPTSLPGIPFLRHWTFGAMNC